MSGKDPMQANARLGYRIALLAAVTTLATSNATTLIPPGN